MQQLNKLIEFRQAVYHHGLTKARDTQFELMDSLLLSPGARSFAELSCSAAFRRSWPSLYTAIEDGDQDLAWIEERLVQQVPPRDVSIYALDCTAWPHPQSRTLADRQYVHTDASPGTRTAIVIGHPYSLLSWIAEEGTSWALPVSAQRIRSQQRDIAVGVEQVQQLHRYRQKHHIGGLLVVVADGQYGNHKFLGPLANVPAAIVSRLRCNRVLYRDPTPEPGRRRGRKRIHGDRFALLDPTTWGPPAAQDEQENATWGRVRLRRWDNLHAQQDATCHFSVLLVEAHLDRERPVPPF